MTFPFSWRADQPELIAEPGFFIQREDDVYEQDCEAIRGTEEGDHRQG
jgi:hypothetical protein